MMLQIGEIRKASELGYHQSYRKYIWALCEKCGGPRWIPIIRGKPGFPVCRPCADKIKGQAHRGEKNSQWKGGRGIDRGYILIKLQPDNFFYPMANHNSYVFEHRLVMAQHLGRCLQPWEKVHHKDGIKDHNVYNNLKLTTAGSHAIEHNKGYRDGYRQGYQDGQSEAIKELSQRVTLLEAEVTLLRGQLEKDEARTE